MLTICVWPDWCIIFLIRFFEYIYIYRFVNPIYVYYPTEIIHSWFYKFKAIDFRFFLLSPIAESNRSMYSSIVQPFTFSFIRLSVGQRLSISTPQTICIFFFSKLVNRPIRSMKKSFLRYPVKRAINKTVFVKKKKTLKVESGKVICGFGNEHESWNDKE